MAAAVSAGKVLWLPEPATSWFIGSEVTMPDNLKMWGAGVASLFTSSPTYPLKGANGVTGLDLRNFQIAGTYANNSNCGITVLGSGSALYLDGLTVRDCGFSGIYASAALTDSIIRNTTVHHCGDMGIHFKDGSGNVLIEDCLAYDFQNPQYPPHPYYGSRCTGRITLRRCEGHTVSHLPNGYGGIQMFACADVVIEDCNMHHNRPPGENDGYGYIFNDGTNAALYRCIGTKAGYTGPCLDNYYTFYEAWNSPGVVTYDEDCVGALRVAP